MRGKQVVRPRDRRAQRLLARVGVATAGEEVEPLREPLEDLGRGERPRARGCQLNRERERVEAGAELGDLRRRLDLRPFGEEGDGLRSERRDRELDLALDAEQLCSSRAV